MTKNSFVTEVTFDFEHISHIALACSLLTFEQVNPDWVQTQEFKIPNNLPVKMRNRKFTSKNPFCNR